MPASGSQQQVRGPQLLALVAAYGAASTTLRTNLLSHVGNLWKQLGSYRNADMAKFIRQIVPVIQGAEQQMAANTAAFIAQQRQIALGGTATPAAVRLADVTGRATRNGTAPAEVYGRPFHQVWRDIGAGKNPTQAIDEGLTYVQNLAATDLQRTKQLTGQKIVSADRKAIGTRRILEGDHSCGLCIVASTMFYIKKELLPIHPGCDCGQEVIYADEASHLRALNLGRLQDVHQAIADAFGRDSSAARTIPGALVAGKPVAYKDVLVTHEHGELGPILAVRGQHFTGPSDLS